MSYTHQKVSWEMVDKQDMYADLSYKDPVTITARKQPKEEVFNDYLGKQRLSRSYFYVDPLIEPNALSIEPEDKLDGEVIKKKYIMYDLMGKPKMLRFITI